MLAYIKKLSYLCSVNKKEINNLKTSIMNKQIANTILSQLGGHKFIVMTGAKNFVAIENGIRFNIGQNGSKANMVKVVLDWDDTYTMQFIKIGKQPNIYSVMMRYANKGLNEEQFNETVKKAYDKACKNAEPQVLKQYSGLFFDQLQEFFTDYTKMYTRLF